MARSLAKPDYLFTLAGWLIRVRPPRFSHFPLKGRSDDVSDRCVRPDPAVPGRPGFLGAVRGFFEHKYRTVNALSGIDFSIAQGELVGYIGPNGAGKSTTIKILSGILNPTAGECTINELVP